MTPILEHYTDVGQREVGAWRFDDGGIERGGDASAKGHLHLTQCKMTTRMEALVILKSGHGVTAARLTSSSLLPIDPHSTPGQVAAWAVRSTS